MSSSFVPLVTLPAAVVEPATLTPAPVATPDRVVVSGDVEWRSTARHLWVGRSDEQHAGIIEHGRNYRLTDADGNFRGSFPTLELAMDAAHHTDDLPIVDFAAPELWGRAQMAATIAGLAAMALAAIGMIVR